MALDLLDPGRRSGDGVVVEQSGVQQFVELHVAVVAFDYPGLGLQRADYLPDAPELFRTHLGGLVQQHHVAEFDLLDDEVLDVLLVYVVLQEEAAAFEFVLHPEGVHHGHYAVQPDGTVLVVFFPEVRDGGDGAGDGLRFADAAGLDHDVVETAG